MEPLKITDLEVFRMCSPNGDSTNWTFVRIHTDEGIHGVGEGSLQYKDAALEAELLDFRKFLIGKDPFQIERIWTSLHRRVTWTGGAVTISADQRYRPGAVGHQRQGAGRASV